MELNAYERNGNLPVADPPSHAAAHQSKSTALTNFNMIDLEHQEGCTWAKRSVPHDVCACDCFTLINTKDYKSMKIFMKAYYAWALSPDGTGGELFDDMVMAAEALPPE